ncbi:MAG: triose-phosphate isomerase [Marinilabiliaceae bacterium]|nr:triose-phosphate isomerase [Marinilabiliaceae bacterium]
MRKKIVAGNWKMNKNYAEGIELAKEVSNLVGNKTFHCEIILGTPFIHLAEAVKVVNSQKISVAAQNCANKPSGAYTGEVSAEMIKSTGASHVIIGHSERRAYYAETYQTLKEKVDLALQNNLIPIFCIGEKLSERETSIHFDIVKAQIQESLFHLSEENFGRIVLAYEPVWAIGTGVTATPDQAQEMHFFIRNVISDKYGKGIADVTTILYGGSCNPSNAKELFSNPDVDGGLIGGASLKADDFLKIVDAF